MIFNVIFHSKFSELTSNALFIGRPKIHFSSQTFSVLCKQGFNKKQIAQLLHISTKTLCRRITEYGVEHEGDYTDDNILTDDVLDAEI